MVTALSVYRFPSSPKGHATNALCPSFMAPTPTGAKPNGKSHPATPIPQHPTAAGKMKNFLDAHLVLHFCNAQGSDISMLFFNAFILRTRERIQVCICIMQRNANGLRINFITQYL